MALQDTAEDASLEIGHPAYELQSKSKLLRGGYIGDYIRDYYRVIKGDTRSLEYSS